MVFWPTVGAFALFWLAYPLIGANDHFKDLRIAISFGWIAYGLFAVKQILAACDPELDCGPQRRQTIVALVIIGGLVPVVTLLESWNELASQPTAYAISNFAVPATAFGFLFAALVLTLRTPPRGAKPPASSADAAE